MAEERTWPAEWVNPPLPDNDDDCVNVLTGEQQARAAALHDARAALERRGGLSSGIPPTADDLIYVARWIICGCVLRDDDDGL